ncbi:hypothetical protein F4779DRAFT_23809 [Xylariaceae sp. FL0662B]|nr:hypothetical protein F4779DRAFT_23809 [Xylariaceae sp. FL0662B]
MPPVQNTFSIIPNPPSAAPDARPSRPPMTTKQAKKAYNKATKGPKLSRAERRRQELFEQDRIRRELEKERNQARARAARDKRREKEENERAEKKKKGLPLVQVRPSQDTIARFVRSNAKKPASKVVASPTPVENDDNANDNDNDGDSDSGSHTLSPEDECAPPLKKRKTGIPDNAQADTGYATCSSAVVDGPSSSTRHNNTKRSTPKTIKPADQCSTPKQASIDPDDSEIVELVEQQLFSDAFSALSSPPRDEKGVQDGKTGPPQKHPLENPSPSKPSVCPPHSATTSGQSSQKQKAVGRISLSPTRQPLQPLSEKETNTRHVGTQQQAPTGQLKPTIATGDKNINSLTSVSRKHRPSVPASRSFRHPKTPMGPPPVPPKFKSPGYSPAKEPRTPQFIFKRPEGPKLRPAENPSQVLSAQQTQESPPPTSTQMFICSHLDDFLPTPSQEMRELFEDPKVNPPMGEPKPRTTHPVYSPVKTHPSADDIPSISSLGCPVPMSRDNIVQDRHIRDNTSYGQPSNPHTFARSSGNIDPFNMPFFSTQDLVLSSQDMKDLEETSSPLKAKPIEPKHRSKIALSIHDNLSQQEASPSRVGDGLKTFKGEQVAKPVQQLASDHKRSSNGYNHSIHHQARAFSVCASGDAALRTQESRTRQPIREARSNTTPVTNPPQWPKPLENTTQHRASMPSRDKLTGIARLETKHPTQHSKSKAAAPPRPKPRPFFTSSGREAQYKYTIERSKTSAWEGALARRKAQNELEQFQRLEDERRDQLLLEGLRDEEEDMTIEDYTVTPKSNAVHHSQTRDQAPPQTVNSLPSQATKNMSSQGAKKGNADPKRRTRPKSSYDEMLELLEREKARAKERNLHDDMLEQLEREEGEEQRDLYDDDDMMQLFEHENTEPERDKTRGRTLGQEQEQGGVQVPASQETDYGDAGLDNVLCEIL